MGDEYNVRPMPSLLAPASAYNAPPLLTGGYAIPLPQPFQPVVTGPQTFSSVQRGPAQPHIAGSFILRGPSNIYSTEAIAFGEGMLASTGDDSLTIWSLADCRIVRSLNGRRGNRFEATAWNPKQLTNSLVSLTSKDQLLRLWDLRAKSDSQPEIYVNMEMPSSLCWSSDGMYLGIGSTLSGVGVFDIRQGRLLSAKKLDSPVHDVAFVNGLLSCATARGSLYVLSPNDLQIRSALPAHLSDVTCIEVNPNDPSSFVTGGNDALVEMWQASSSLSTIDYVCRTTMDRHVSRIDSIAISGNNSWVASSSRGERIVHVCSAKTGELFVSIEAEVDDNVRAVAFDRSSTDPSKAVLAYCTLRSRDVFVKLITSNT